MSQPQPNITQDAALQAPVKDTPMMRQYWQLKEQVGDCVLFFRMGDFYEMFEEDAKTASRVLAIALTSRDKKDPDPTPMCGVPFRAVDSYIAKMVEAGHKVAIGDQVEDPKMAKGLVKREITRVITPGMFTDPNHLEPKDNRFLAALHFGKDQVGLACLDLSSGEFRASRVFLGPPLNDELARLEPAELVLAESQASHPGLSRLSPDLLELPRSLHPGRPPTPRQAADILDRRAPEEWEHVPPEAIGAAAMAWAKVQETQRKSPDHVEDLALYRVEGHLVLDAGARRNLELFRSIAGGGRQGSLLGAVDMTATPMGARLLREWLGFPLFDLARIEARHQAVDELVNDPMLRGGLIDQLKELPDLARLVGRAGLGQASPRDLASLRDALELLPGLQNTLAPLASPLVRQQADALGGLEELAAGLRRTLAESPPLSLAEGGVIAAGVNAELDQLRQMSGQGKDWIASLQSKLRAETGIPSLKVGFNRVFGYYLDVTKTHAGKVPDYFIRKQTLANSERYFTPELKQWEEKVLGAEDKAAALERELFEDLRALVAAQSRPLMACARALAGVDVLAGLAELAQKRDYVRPKMALDGELDLKGGRHPVVERMLGEGGFVPNDVWLDDTAQQVIIITGPNMAGKSTILRQTALIVLLAQAGSFVPADSARIPLIDRIFTRVGAMDDLARGRSTFMVEMTETSQILAQATPRSLVILDEVGRGTSTFDGLSLAWAVAEHLHDLDGVGVKTLFATHYHELVDLAQRLERVKNYNVSVKEIGGRITFLRTLKPGGVSRSYGLQVARLAGLPASVLDRAQEILSGLEKDDFKTPEPAGHAQPAQGQLALFRPVSHPVVERLKNLNIDNMSPIQALNLLAELQSELD